MSKAYIDTKNILEFLASLILMEGYNRNMVLKRMVECHPENSTSRALNHCVK